MPVSETENRNFLQLMALSGLIFLATYFAHLWCSRPSADDFFFIGKLLRESPQEITLNFYENYGGRWWAYLSQTTFLKFFGAHWGSILFPLCLSFLLFFKLHLIIGSFLPNNKRKNEIYLLSLFLFQFLFFLCIDKGESFFWMSATASYLQPLSFSVLLIGLLLQAEIKFWYYPLCLLLGLLIAPGSEIFFLPVFIILLMMVFRLEEHERKFKGALLLATLATLVLGFITQISSPGNDLRLNALNRPGMLTLLKISGMETARFLFNLVIYKWAELLLFGGVLLIWLKKYPNPVKGNYFSGVRLAGFLFIGLSALVPAAYILAGPPPARALLPAFAFIVAMITLVGLRQIPGRKLKFLSPKIISILAGGALLLYQTFMAWDNIPKAFLYAGEYDKAISQLKISDAKMESGINYLEPLPDSGFLFPLQIDSDTGSFYNRHLKEGLQLKNPVLPSSGSSRIEKQ